jgi:hypothetical protein
MRNESVSQRKTATEPDGSAHSGGSLFKHGWTCGKYGIPNVTEKTRPNKTKNEKLISYLVSQLEELYSYKPAVLPTHRHMFLADVATHLEQRPHLDGLEDWIHTFGPAIHSSMKQARTREILEAILPQQ